MKIGLASNDWSRRVRGENFHALGIMGGSGWIRLGQYARYTKHDSALGVLAWDPNQGIFGVVDRDENFHWDCNIVVMQRVWHIDLIGQIRKARANGQIIINDLDDWYWGIDPKNLAFQNAKPNADAINNVVNYRNILAASTAVTVSTPYLADRLTWVDKNNRIVFPNHVETDKFAKRVHKDEDPTVVGWVGSTAHRSGDLGLMRGVLSQLDNSFSFHHTGAYEKYPMFADEAKLPPERVTVLSFCTPDEYPHYAFPFDIGIVPLKILPFNQAKSWIKGIEYASANIPFIASPSVEYERLQREYGVGRLAKNAQKWLRHINDLKSASAREEEAARNLEAIKPLNIKIGAQKWDKMMESFL